MAEFLQLASLPLLLTLAAYQVGLICQRRFKTALANPILIGVLLVLAVFALTGLTNAEYQKGAGYISWLTTPATICLAIPMYEHFQTLKRSFASILAGVCAGAVSCLAVVVLFSLVFRFDRALAISLLPKSITSAIGVPLGELSGGLPPITMSAIIFTGVMSSMLGPVFCRWFRLTDPLAQGVAFGTAGHVIGTAKASEMDSLAGAVGSLSLVVAGLLTAAIFPLFTAFV